MPDTYDVRFCDIMGTPWRRMADTQPQAEFQNTDMFANFYSAFEGQVPRQLAQRIYEHGTVCILKPDGTSQQCGEFERIEIALFSLPFPANQVVASLVLDFTVNAISNDENSILAALLKGASEARIIVDDKPVIKIAGELAEIVKVKPSSESSASDRPLTGEWERHALVFADGNALKEEADREILGLLFGIRWPYRREFTTVDRPEDLNRERGSYAAVSDHASFFHRQPDVVQNSILLTTVQAVGTAARFQSIWRDAYNQVNSYQTNKQRPTGFQTRKDLEHLADEMGNLELDLAFSVETVADLGLGSTTAQIDAFHRALYQAMQIKTRATTVGQMFLRLNGSIRSELTAIESREKEVESLAKEVEERRRFRVALMIGAFSLLIAPLGVVLGFFGINAVEVDNGESMFELHRYWPIYAAAIAFMVAIFSATAALTFGPGILRSVRRMHRRRAKSTT